MRAKQDAVVTQIKVKVDIVKNAVVVEVDMAQNKRRNVYKGDDRYSNSG